MQKQPHVSRQLLQRLVTYLNFLRSMPSESVHVSATYIADGLGWGDVQVRKDLAAVSSGGRPKVGYAASSLVADIERYLGCDAREDAVLVGAGNLGRALLSYRGFASYGFHIVCAFDSNPGLADQTFGEKPVRPLEQLADVCKCRNISIGILTVPPDSAQQACDCLVQAGVRAIWNFAPVHLTAPGNVHIHNENMAASLALLSNHLSSLLDKTAAPAVGRIIK